jgi:hypothetical protein
MSGGATAVPALHDFLGPEPDDLELTHMRAELPQDTVTQAPEVWARLADDPSPAWRKTAAAILVRDWSQTLIDKVVHMALEDGDRAVRNLARHRLQEDVPTIASPAVAEYVLDQLDQQFTLLGETTVFMLDLTRKCLSGLSTDQQGLPPDLARRALVLLRRILARAHPILDFFTPLLAALAFPEFGEAAGELERLLDTLTDAAAQRHLLETLIAIQAPSLPKLALRLARSTRRSALQQQASDYLVEVADINHLVLAPSDLTYVACRIAIRKGIRFQRVGFRHKVILPNGATYARPAQ